MDTCIYFIPRGLRTFPALFLRAGGLRIRGVSPGNLDIILQVTFLAARCSVSETPEESIGLDSFRRRLRGNVRAVSAVLSTVNARLRQHLEVNFIYFPREGGLCALTAVCGTQLDRGVVAVGYGPGGLGNDFCHSCQGRFFGTFYTGKGAVRGHVHRDTASFIRCIVRSYGETHGLNDHVWTTSMSTTNTTNITSTTSTTTTTSTSTTTFDVDVHVRTLTPWIQPVSSQGGHLCRAQSRMPT